MNALQRISTGIELLEGGYVVEWTPSRETEPGVRAMAYPNYDRRLMEALWGASELVGTDYDYVNRVDEVRDGAAYLKSAHALTEGDVLEFWTRKGNGTHYKAIAIHGNAETRKNHEDMGFHHGWGTVVEQMVAHIKKKAP